MLSLEAMRIAIRLDSHGPNSAFNGPSRFAVC